MKDEFENIKNIFKDRRGVFNLFKNKAIGLSISTEHDLYSVLDMFQDQKLNRVKCLEDHLKEAKKGAKIYNIIDKMNLKVRGPKSKERKNFPQNLPIFYNVRCLRIES